MRPPDWALRLLFCIRFFWQRRSHLLATSEVTFEWTVPRDALLTQYRMVYYGVARSLLGNFAEFTGTSNTFTVTDGTCRHASPIVWMTAVDDVCRIFAEGPIDKDERGCSAKVL